MKKVTLFITRDENEPGYYRVIVDGEGFVESVGKAVGGRIRGDDEWLDDTYFGVGACVQQVLPGGRFTLGKTVHKTQLNEDWGHDEIYAVVEVEGAGTFKSNTVKGYF
ncbi:MAG TPA: hypothetical protein VFR78_16180 [Pyrinomonadaceae bacterium]|nr:hypothetical protein [Pyrinomonadaceae bacterium]